MTGMLWSDFSKQPLAAKIEQAAAGACDRQGRNRRGGVGDD
jgi:hypothetical protein